jgi:hypothetical protein
VRCYGKTCWGTHWELKREHKGKTLGTREKRKKILPLLPTPTLLNLEGRKARHLETMLGASHWVHEISLPKRVSSSPFLACANTLCKQTPYLFFSLFLLS